MLGPQGALPLSITEEAYYYGLEKDDAFPRFLDIFNHRFIQLFFRAWADARPIVQHDRPAEDRFFAYIGSAIGIGTKPYQNLDSLPDAAKLPFAGLLGAQARCASRLSSAICGLFKVTAEVQEFVGTRLVIEEAELTTLGGRGSVCSVKARSSVALFSAFKIRSGSESLPEIWPSTCVFFLRGIYASLSLTSFSFTMASSSIGMSN